MSLNVALLDKSEITKKMISHSLHHYFPKIHRFETEEEFLSHSELSKWDVVIVDWAFKKENKPLALSLQNQSSQPLIVLYRESSLELEQVKYSLKKPIDPKQLRDLISKWVPKANKLKLNSFLTYPSTLKPDEKEAEKKASQDKEVLFDLPPIDSSKKTEVPFIEKTTPPSSSKPSHPSSKPSLSPFPQSQPPSTEKGLDTKIILKVLDEYKNTLEFEQLMEKALKGYGEQMMKKIVEKEGLNLLEKTIDSYKDSPVFYEQIQKVLKNYLEKESPLQKNLEQRLLSFAEKKFPEIAKKIIEKEIQKLLNEVR